ncbi:ABC transporter permease [Thermoflexus sp.]|uniref:ABC transporter permease n=1 Tax=Thermoflexus sp. TaxID=1969742 RepID=UPI002ADD5F6B|nr:ABC transporter permease [Thermoflexus sp.]
MFTSGVYDSARRPPAFWEELVALWTYRDLIYQMVARDIKVRYKRSVLGVAWTMLNPLLMMIVLTLVFSHLFRFDLPNYPVYLLSGTLIWNFFAQTTTLGMQQLVWGGGLLHRIYVPRTVFAVSSLGTGLVNLALALIPLSGIMLLTGAPFRPALAFLPVAVLQAALFTLGVSLLLSSLAAVFPDTIEMYQVLLTAGYFLTPIFYPERILPESLAIWLKFNPIHHVVAAFRGPIYWGIVPSIESIVATSIMALLVLAVGWLVFTSRAEHIIYRL